VTISVDEILQLRNARKEQRGRQFEVARQVRDMVNGDMAVPLPEFNGMTKPAVANLAALGLDGISQRIASTMPYPHFPVLREGIQASIIDARNRRDVVEYWWEQDRMDLKLARRARYYTGYAFSPVMIKPGKDRPEWVLRDSLTAFPADGDVDDPCVEDCVFEFQRPWGWLLRNYPQADRLLRSKQTRLSDNFTMVEFADANEWVLLCEGRAVPGGADANYGSSPTVELERVENRIGMCPVASAGRITLDRPAGQFDGVLGMYWQQSALMALDVIAVQRGVFPQEWLVGTKDGFEPVIVREADGMRGVTGIVKNGTMVTQNLNPGYKTTETLDRIERSIRLTGRIPAEFGGESGSNIRTGARGDAVLASVVDFPVQEAQRAFARSLQYENKLAIAIDKAYFGPRPKVIWFGDRKVNYVPDTLWQRDGYPCDEHVVSYSFAGVDANSLRLSTLQSTGAGTMSKRRGMELDPLIEDVDRELNRIQIEQIDMAGMSAIQQQAAQGAIPPNDIARIKQLMREGMEWEDAVQRAHGEAQARQATPAPPEAPEAQPGLAQPGMGAEQPGGPPTLNGPTGGESNLSDLIRRLKATAPAAA
jgi:hypothetical protein